MPQVPTHWCLILENIVNFYICEQFASCVLTKVKSLAFLQRLNQPDNCASTIQVEEYVTVVTNAPMNMPSQVSFRPGVSAGKKSKMNNLPSVQTERYHYPLLTVLPSSYFSIRFDPRSLVMFGLLIKFDPTRKRCFSCHNSACDKGLPAIIRMFTLL